MEKRSISIDYIKCLACLLIINSHLSSLYPRQFHFLSLGGYFGNSLFFFASGYCLINIKDSFHKWYWKRFTRVYIPYLCMLPFFFFDGELADLSILNVVIPFQKFHFIPTILILYVPYYCLTLLDQKTWFKYHHSVITSLMVTLLYFFFLFDYNHENVIGHFQFTEMNFYLIIMLLGAMVRQGRGLKNGKALAVIGIFTFGVYTFQSLRSFTGALVILKPIAGITFSYSAASLIIKLNNKLRDYSVVCFVSSLTLEAYLTHFISIRAFSETGFPTNIVYACISTFGVAYCLHLISNKVKSILGGNLRRI